MGIFTHSMFNMSPLVVLVFAYLSVCYSSVDGAQQEDDAMVPELTYFDIRGRGEVTRMLFYAAGRKFVDTRVDFATQWPGTLKAEMPFGLLPILNVSGHIYSQSIAIQNFVARETDMYGRSSRDQLMIDQISYAKEDLFVYEEKFLAEPDLVKKLSAADITIHEATQTISQTNPAMLDKYPDIKTLRAKVANSKGLKQYLATRKMYFV